MDAVLPLAERDITRARRILLPSIAQNMHCLDTLHVIVPDADVELAKMQLGSFRFVRIWREYELVPRRQGARRLRGWFRQQICKLAAHRLVKSEFYLTLDADVICARPVTEDRLVLRGRAVTQVEEIDRHPSWSAQSASALNIPASRLGYGVTPAVLHRQSVAELLHYLAAQNESWRQKLEALPMPTPLRRQLGYGTAIGYLFRHVPWTEYTLYFTYLEHTGQLDARHALAFNHPLYGNCIWKHDSIESFDAKAIFEGEGPLFTVVQSISAATIDEIVSRVRPYISDTGSVYWQHRQ